MIILSVLRRFCSSVSSPLYGKPHTGGMRGSERERRSEGVRPVSSPSTPAQSTHRGVGAVGASLDDAPVVEPLARWVVAIVVVVFVVVA